MSKGIDLKSLKDFAVDLRKKLTKDEYLIVLFAHNGTGKTRSCMEFKELGKTVMKNILF